MQIGAKEKDGVTDDNGGIERIPCYGSPDRKRGEFTRTAVSTDQ